MTKTDEIFEQMLKILKKTMGDKFEEYTFPPPVFVTMKGKFVALDMEAGTMSARFPVFERDLNPYGTLQGGMIAAAVDNTIGPLSVLIAPPNVTRTLEMTYSRPVLPEMGAITVEARLIKREERSLHLAADVRGPDGTRLARAKATHIILA